MTKYDGIIKVLEESIKFKDDGSNISISLNDTYFKLMINGREYYWNIDGRFDGTGTWMVDLGDFPPLVNLYEDKVGKILDDKEILEALEDLKKNENNIVRLEGKLIDEAHN